MSMSSLVAGSWFSTRMKMPLGRQADQSPFSDFRGSLQALDLDCVILVQGIEVFGSGAGHQQQGRTLLLCGGSQYGDGAEGESQQHQQVVQWLEKRHSSSYSPVYVFRLFPREGRFAPWSLIVYFFYARVIVVLGYSASTKLKM